MSKVLPPSAAADAPASAAPADATPLSLQDIRLLAQLLSEYGLSELTLTRAGGDHLCLRREVLAPPAAAPPAGLAYPVPPAAHPGLFAGPPARSEPAPAPVKAANLVAVTSPFVGTFYRAANPESPAFVEVGQRVRKGQTLCIIEAMKLMNELESDVDGVVVEIPAQNGRPVEYGQVLFQLDVG